MFNFKIKIDPPYCTQKDIFKQIFEIMDNLTKHCKYIYPNLSGSGFDRAWSLKNTKNMGSAVGWVIFEDSSFSYL